MKAMTIVAVLIAIMVIPSVIILSDEQDTAAATTTPVIPTQDSTAATLTFVSSGNDGGTNYTNWQLDISVVRTHNYGARFDCNNQMSSLAGDNGVSTSYYEEVAPSGSGPTIRLFASDGFRRMPAVAITRLRIDDVPPIL